MCAASLLSAPLVGDGFDDAALVDAAGVRYLAQVCGADPREERLRQARLVLLAHHKLACAALRFHSVLGHTA